MMLRPGWWIALLLLALSGCYVSLDTDTDYDRRLSLHELFQPVRWDDTLAVGGTDQMADSLFRYLQAHEGFSGTVLAASGGRILHTGAYGYANEDTHDTLTLNSVFQLASVSKIFTATAVLLLYEQGRLRLDDPVEAYLPGFPYPEITIRMLLHHRSGLPLYMHFARTDWLPDTLMTCLDVADHFRRLHPRLKFAPGTAYEYNNSNYALLAAVVTHAACMPFETFVTEHIFEPLGMHHTWYADHVTRMQRPHATVGYRKNGKSYEVAGGDFLDGVMGDKGLHSNLADLYTFDRALAQGVLLQTSSLELAYTPGSPERAVFNYGMGWRINTAYPGVIFHFGWWRGYRTCFIRNVWQDHTLIILSNRDNLEKNIDYWRVYQLIFGWNQTV
ncbi:MAG: serine hydrolase domain-containing protein [Bacteroidia bacterium]|nr:serine hydrolase domain-containing protein [Bacteroidia bacterium]